MRNILTLLLISQSILAFAQNEKGRLQVGLLVNMNISQLKIQGALEPNLTSDIQWSAGAGMMLRIPLNSKFDLESQLSIEENGSGKATYCETVTHDFLRVYDRYRSIPLSVIANRALGENGKWSIGGGVKSSFVFNHKLRHDVALPSGGTGTVLSPDVKKWFGSVALQLTRKFSNADIGLIGWYGLTPEIDHNGIMVTPYGVSFCVKPYWTFGNE